ncbi:uncharacterized protein be isoform X1 [Euwallacea fornicatus]|uniref:uncharacterized protein be isoform X1 n=1 Tax=Euwallacea fornicatus TaxID=995702 RepID=UPI00338EBC08
MMPKSAERFWLLVLVPTTVALGLVVAQTGGYTICDVPGCNCTIPAGGWKNVNCYLEEDQELVLQQGHIPKEVTEIFLNGGRSITFGSKTFSDHKALALLHLSNVQKVVVGKQAFFNIQSSSLLVQMLGCDDLIFKSQAFYEMLGSLSTEIIGASYLKLEESPFSKLSNGTFQDIKKIELDSGAFEIKNLGTTGRHGPVSVVLFVNVDIEEILQGVFRTSLAQIAFINSRIKDIKFEAFTSAEISSVSITNTTINQIHQGALTDRTLVVDFRINKCWISQVHSKAITAGMTNLTVIHSTITDIHSKAIASTAAKVKIVGNQIVHLHSMAFAIQNWNRITIDQNVIKNLHRDFIVTSTSESEVESFSFKGNEIYNLMEGSLSFVQKVEDGKLVFDDNFFNQSCSCDLSDWISTLTNTTTYRTELIMDSSFCTVDESVSRCFSLPVGIINMKNFTQKTCFNNTVCAPYNGETRTINTTGKIFVADDDSSEKRHWLIFIVVLIGFFILALVTTFVALLVRGSRWLKRKEKSGSGYFRNHYYNNNQSNEEENTIVTVDTENEKLEMPAELTVEFLHELSRRLDDPSTHQDASEMIERLYEMFIVDDSYENNNREEEAHLYEELGNLSLQIPPPPYEEHPPQASGVGQGPRGILKLMEEKFNPNCTAEAAKEDTETDTKNTKPVLTSMYSEPIDKDVHLYSELKQKDEAKRNGTDGSLTMRPLPDKPGPSK